MSLSECNGLDDYLQAYGACLGARATKSLAPLHNPTKDTVDPMLKVVDDHVHKKRNSRVFKAQAHFITGIVKAWDRPCKSVFVGARQGTGKSLMGSAACHIAAKGKPYRALVMCPDHLINKWVREIMGTCPDVSVRHFDNWRDVLSYVQNLPAGKPTENEWLILGRDQSKFDPKWEPRYAIKKRIKSQGLYARRNGAKWSDCTIDIPVCPRCGKVVTDKNGNAILVEDFPKNT